ncbi:hypothetical protein C8J57DRAFT_1527726 [Mycena rebaudengoi]|nr:hypothetical protein C8J57DRAFT_1527726 [Mycena rebaudengoi]
MDRGKIPFRHVPPIPLPTARSWTFSILSASSGNHPLQNLGTHDTPSFFWNVTIAPGTEVIIEVADSTGDSGRSSAFAIQRGGRSSLGWRLQRQGLASFRHIDTAYSAVRLRTSSLVPYIDISYQAHSKRRPGPAQYRELTHVADNYL